MEHGYMFFKNIKLAGIVCLQSIRRDNIVTKIPEFLHMWEIIWGDTPKSSVLATIDWEEVILDGDFPSYLASHEANIKKSFWDIAKLNNWKNSQVFRHDSGKSSGAVIIHWLLDRWEKPVPPGSMVQDDDNTTNKNKTTEDTSDASDLEAINAMMNLDDEEDPTYFPPRVLSYFNSRRRPNTRLKVKKEHEASLPEYRVAKRLKTNKLSWKEHEEVGKREHQWHARRIEALEKHASELEEQTIKMQEMWDLEQTGMKRQISELQKQVVLLLETRKPSMNFDAEGQHSQSESIYADHGHKLSEHDLGRESPALRGIPDTLEAPPTGNSAPSVSSQTNSDSLPRNFAPAAPTIDDGFAFPAEAASGNQPSTLDAILNASQHFRKLDKLEYETARLCGMERYPQEAGGFEGWLHQRKDFSSYQNAFSILASAFRNQRHNGFCDREFNILVEAQDRRDVAVAHVITEDVLNYLSSERFYTHPDSQDSVRGLVMDDFDTLIEALLRKFQDPEQKHYTAEAPKGVGDHSERVLKLQFIYGVLVLGLISFSGSHVCRFDLNVWGISMKTIDIGDGYKFTLRDLACMDEFIGGPAWVLVKERHITDVPKLKVSLTLKQFADLWGPVWFIKDELKLAPIVRTERGFIVPLPHEQCEEKRWEEIECHWTTSLPSSTYAELASQQELQLSETSQLLIGSDISEKSRFQVNTECHSQINIIEQRIANQLQIPGAAAAHYVRDGYEIGLTGGQYFGVIGNGVFRRVPARTQKTVLVEQCTKPETPLLPFLKLRVGLEISACTGNAQRITLWDALRLAQVSARGTHVTPPGDQIAASSCSHQVGDMNCIVSCWNIQKCHDGIDAFQNIETNPQAIHPQNSGKNSVMAHRPSANITCIEARKLIIQSILALKATGVDHNGNLQAWWPFTDTPMTYRIPQETPAGGNSSYWIPIVKDTRDTSTFAVLSRSCLEFRETGIVRACTTATNTAPANGGHQVQPYSNPKLTNRTILNTRVSIELPSLSQSVCPQATIPSAKGTDLREGTQVKLGEGIFLTVFKTLTQRQAVVLTQPWGVLGRAGQVFKPLFFSNAPRAVEQFSDEVSTGFSLAVFVY